MCTEKDNEELVEAIFWGTTSSKATSLLDKIFSPNIKRPNPYMGVIQSQEPQLEFQQL